MSFFDEYNKKIARRIFQSLVCFGLVFVVAIIPTGMIYAQNQAKAPAEPKFHMTEEEREKLDSVTVDNKAVKIAVTDEIVYWKTADGKENGMLMPFIDFIRDELGLEVEISYKTNGGEAKEQAATDQVDMATLVSINDQRREEFATLDLYTSHLGFITRNERPLRSITALSNKKIGYIKNSPFSESIKTYMPSEDKISYFSSEKVLLEALSDKTIDVAMVSGVRTQLNVLAYPELQIESFAVNEPTIQGVVGDTQVARVVLDLANRFARENYDYFYGCVAKGKTDMIIQRARELYAADIEKVREKYGEINVYDSGILYPLGFNENGEFKGVQREIYDTFTALTDIPVKIEDYFSVGFTGALDRLSTGTSQVCSGVLYNYDDTKEKKLVYSMPIWESDLRMYTYSKRNFNDEDFRALRIGTTKNAYEYLNWKALFDNDAEIFPDRVSMIDALKHDEIDLVFMPEMIYDFNQKILGDSTLRGVGDLHSLVSIHMVLSGDNPELNNLLNNSIKIQKIIYPDSRSKWENEALALKYKYLDMQNAQDKVQAVTTVLLMAIAVTLFVVFVMYIQSRNQKEILRLRAEKEKESNDIKSKFLVNISHEIRTPMNAIIGLSEVQLLKGDPAKARDSFSKINISAKNLLSIINDILDFSKIEAGKLVFIEENAELEEILANIILMTNERLSKEKTEKINVVLEVEESAPKIIFTDKTRLWQILKNVMDNSAKFTLEGHIRLHVDADAKNIIFTITDTGEGMDQDQVERLFIPFEQFGDDARVVKSGTGLGMTITKEIVDGFGGTIAVNSSRGQGTTTIIELPLKELAGDKTVSNKCERYVKRENAIFPDAKVLVCEDNEINQIVAVEILALFGINPTIANNGIECLELLEKQEFDLILMDIIMPVMDGSEATKLIRASDKAYKEIPIVSMTANLVKEELDKYMAYGMNGYIGKPIDIEILGKELDKWLRK